MKHRSSIFDSRRPAAGRGFSFVELLFAVMILGIGLIMIAAIFPVGLSQTKANVDETQAAAIGRSAVGQLAQSATKVNYLASNQVVPMQAVGGTSQLPLLAESNMICAADPRYAWVGLYLRKITNPASDYAQVMFIVANRSDPYERLRDATNITNNARILEPRFVALNLSTSQVTVSASGTTGNARNDAAAAPNTFVIIAGNPAAATTDIAVTDSTGAVSPAIAEDGNAAVNRLAGLVCRLGNGDSGVFSYYPGFEFPQTKFTYINAASQIRNVTILAAPNASGYIVGRNRTTISSPGVPGDFDGPAQDVAFYTSFVSLK